MIIDIHSHIGESIDGGHGKLDVILDVMKEYDIDKTVVFATDEENIGETFEPQNSDVLEAQAKYPDQIIAFTRIIPTAGDRAVLEFKRCLKEGVKGLKMKTMDGYSVETTYPVLDLIDRDKFPVLVHSSHTPESLPSEWEKAIKKYPNVNFILAHGGKDEYRDCARVLNEYENAYADTTTLSWFRTQYIYKNSDASKILWGSDYPYNHQGVELKKFEVLTDNKDDLEKMYYKNALKLLDIN